MRDLLILAAIGGFLLYSKDKQGFGNAVIPMSANTSPPGSVQPANPLPPLTVQQVGAAITTTKSDLLSSTIPLSTATPGQTNTNMSTGSVAATANAALIG